LLLLVLSRVVPFFSTLFCRLRAASVDTLAAAFYVATVFVEPSTTPKALSRETSRCLLVGYRVNPT
jgi:hypothetical protein